MSSVHLLMGISHEKECKDLARMNSISLWLPYWRSGPGFPDERRARRLHIRSEAYGIQFRDEWMGVNDSAALLLSTGLQVIEEQKGISSVNGQQCAGSMKSVVAVIDVKRRDPYQVLPRWASAPNHIETPGNSIRCYFCAEICEHFMRDAMAANRGSRALARGTIK